VLSRLAAYPRNARIIREQGLPNVLKLLRTSSDLTHAPAYEILQTLSAETHESRDYPAWEAWAARQNGE